MNQFNNPDYLRLRTRPRPETPPQGFVDLYFDAETGVFRKRDANGDTESVGGVTNAAVQEAIAADPAASRTALQVETDNFARPENGWWLFKALEAFDSNLPAIGTYLTVAAFGDSVSYRPTLALCRELIERYGQGALGTILLSGNNTEGTSITGGADLSVASTSAVLASTGATYSPGLRMHDISSGGNITVTVPTSAPRAGDWSKMTVVYGDRTSGGTLDIDVTQGGSVVINESIATAGTAALRVVEYDLTDGLLPGANPSIVLSAVGGSVYVLGVMLWRTRGVVPLALNLGGQSLDTQNQVPTASLDLLRTTFAPKLMVHHMKEEDATGADAEAHLDRMVTHFPECTHLVIGQTPDNVADAGNLTKNLFWRDLAEERGFPYFNGYRSLGNSYADVVDLGWQGDGVHLDAAAYKYLAHCIMARFPACERLYNRAKTLKDVAVAQAHEFGKVGVHLMTLLNKQTSNGVIYDNGSSNTPDSRYYFGTTGAGAGYAVGMLMSANSVSNALQVASVIRLRVRTAGIGMAVGTTAWVQIGGSGLLTAPSKAVKSLGIEFANPADVGLTGGLSNAAVRLWCYDGATLTEGPWVALAAFSSTSAYTFVMRYEPGKLTLVGSTDQATLETVITAIRCTLAASTIGYNVYAGAASTGATVGSIKINNADLTPYVLPFDIEPWTR